MTKRLRLILEESEYREIQRAARSRHMSISAWVRQTLAHACRQEPLGDTEKKLEAVRVAAQHQFPTGDIHTMLAEIESGYETGPRP